jgi:arabinofuranosyltransferase
MSTIPRWTPIRTPGRAGFAATALPVGVLLVMGYARRWVSEDAFIDLRVVRHLLAGHGPVFNLGERVEAYTNPLWVALLTVWGSLGGSLEPGAVALGLALSAAGLILAQAGAWRLASRIDAVVPRAPERSGRGRLVLPLGATVFAVIPVVWDFATSGLEPGLSMAWMGGVFCLLARRGPPTPGRGRLAAFLVGCGPLIRPDLALFSLGFAAALGVVVAARASDRRRAAREWVGLALAGLALPLAYQIFRMGYFAALAKEATAAYWSQGWRYTLDFGSAYVLWVPLLVVMAWIAALLGAALRSGDRVAVALILAPVVSGLGHWVYVTRVGGDFMHGRLLLPTLLALLLPVAVVIVPSRALRGAAGMALVGVASWAVTCGAWLRAPYAGQGSIGPTGIVDERGFYARHTMTPNPVHLDDYLRQPNVDRVRRDFAAHHRVLVLDGGPDGLVVASRLAPTTPESVRLVAGLLNGGARGYLAGSDVHIVDRLGLTDPIASRLVLTERGRPGHEKTLPDTWIVARFGDPGSATGVFGTAPDAAAALGCGDLARLLRAVEAPLTVHRFLGNIREAWTFHRLRIPVDPTAARKRLCAGPGARGQS